MKVFVGLLQAAGIALLLMACRGGGKATITHTAVRFSTSDTAMQRVFDMALEKCGKHISDFHGYRVLIEGGGYNNVWLETQPMGGVMYAKHDLEVARNNVEIFMDYQREDGRMPGLVRNTKDTLDPDFFRFQGNCFPMPAYDLYFLLGKDRHYLQKVYNSLEAWDAYLWSVRDSDGDGCLETWCYHDTGEDHSVRFGTSPTAWPYDFPPTKENVLNLSIAQEEMDALFSYQVRPMTAEQKEEWESRGEIFHKILDNMPVPQESMDIMSYSYSNRDVLAKISRELGNGKEAYWRKRAEQVRRKVKSYLWDPERNACYDRDKNNETIDILTHNNLRCMWYGSFDQEMADAFVKEHLLDPEEFWTPFPLPSIAVNDPMFRNAVRNDWSGQPQGLTYQRAIRALENYGHYSTLTRIGEKLLQVSGKYQRFPQQYDPFTGVPGDKYNIDYGPVILASLEYISRLYGIHLVQDQVYWSCLDRDQDLTYVREWGKRVYKLKTDGSRVTCMVDGEEVFSFDKGGRVVTDLEGKILEIIAIEPEEGQIELRYNGGVLPLTLVADGRYSL